MINSKVRQQNLDLCAVFNAMLKCLKQHRPIKKAKRLAFEFDLMPYPGINRWLDRVSNTPGYVSIDWRPDN